jgi:hypothetical protein
MAYGVVNADLMTTSDGVSSSGLYGFKNRIINGAMVIDQRNAGASITPTDGQFSLDRWGCRLSQSSKYSVQQNAGSVTPPVGFNYYLGVTSLSAYSVTSTDNFQLQHRIEGYNFGDLNWGTANAKTITISFWVYSSLTGTFGGALDNASGNRAYPFTYSIPTANTWTQISVIIAGDTSGTWNTTNGRGVEINFGLGVGSTYSGTAGSWSSNFYLSATGATSVVGTNGATFYITGVQLEKGSTATSFDYRPYSAELAMCQRYYQVSENFIGGAGNTTSFSGNINFIVTMRTSPTVGQTAVLSITDIANADYSQSSTNISITTGTRVTSNAVSISANNFSGLTTNRPLISIPNVTGKVTLSSEL